MTDFVRVLKTRIEPEDVPTKMYLPDKSNRAVIMAELLVCFIGVRHWDNRVESNSPWLARLSVIDLA